MKNLMEERAKTIRREVKSRQWKQGRSGYPRELREQVVEYAEARQQQGARAAMIARELGLAAQTLKNWLSGRSGWGEERTAACQWREVRLETRTASTDMEKRVSLVTPQGYRIEGLQVSELVEVLRRLG